MFQPMAGLRFSRPLALWPHDFVVCARLGITCGKMDTTARLRIALEILSCYFAFT
jgi:hypothetical protein